MLQWTVKQLLPVRNSYEILHIDENDCAESQNEDITERTIIFERSNKKIHKGTNIWFVNKVSRGWSFHRHEINQKPTDLVIYLMQIQLNMVETWLCLEKVTFGILADNDLIIPYQNVEPTWNTSVEREQKKKNQILLSYT